MAGYLALWISIHHGPHEPAWPFWPAWLVFILLFGPTGLYVAMRRRGKIARASADGVVVGWFFVGSLSPSLPRTPPWRWDRTALRWDVIERFEVSNAKGRDEEYTGLAIDVHRTAWIVLRDGRRLGIASITSDMRPLFLLRHDDPWEGVPTKIDELVAWLEDMAVRFKTRSFESP